VVQPVVKDLQKSIYNGLSVRYTGTNSTNKRKEVTIVPTITITLSESLSQRDANTLETMIGYLLDSVNVKGTVELDGRSSNEPESTMAGFPMGIGRVEYLVETDDDAVWYDILVYTEEAMERVTAEKIRECGKDGVNIVRYVRRPS